MENVKPQEIVIQSTISDSQDIIACTNEFAIKTNQFQSDTLLSSKVFNNTNVINNATEKQHQTELHKLDNCKNIQKGQLRNARNQPIALVTEENDQIPPKVKSFISPKHLKRKIINTHFDQQSKRKFPGPAGLLTGVLEESKDESIGQIELLSQVWYDIRNISPTLPQRGNSIQKL